MTNTTTKMNADLVRACKLLTCLALVPCTAFCESGAVDGATMGAQAAIVAKQKVDNAAVIAALNASNAAQIANNTAFAALENAKVSLPSTTYRCQPHSPPSCSRFRLLQRYM